MNAIPPKMWWSPTQGLISEDRGILVRIMTPDYSRPPGGRTFAHLPVDAQTLGLTYEDDYPALG